MEEGYCDVMVMAAAGLQRLEMGQYISELLDTETMIPACSQGAIAIEIRENDPVTEDILSKINDHNSLIATEAERAFLRTLEEAARYLWGATHVLKVTNFTLPALFPVLTAHSI